MAEDHIVTLIADTAVDLAEYTIDQVPDLIGPTETTAAVLAIGLLLDYVDEPDVIAALADPDDEELRVLAAWLNDPDTVTIHPTQAARVALICLGRLGLAISETEDVAVYWLLEETLRRVLPAVPEGAAA